MIKRKPKTPDNQIVGVIKANLPNNEEAYRIGTGEGVWFLVDKETNDAYNRNARKGTYKGILDNDSVYYPKLVHGIVCPIEMRGNKRPVVPYQWLKDNFSMNGTYYYFDCMDAILGHKLLDPDDLRQLIYIKDSPYNESDIISIAIDYEADLYKCLYKDGQEMAREKLYDALAMYNEINTEEQECK